MSGHVASEVYKILNTDKTTVLSKHVRVCATKFTEYNTLTGSLNPDSSMEFLQTFQDIPEKFGSDIEEFYIDFNSSSESGGMHDAAFEEPILWTPRYAYYRSNWNGHS